MAASIGELFVKIGGDLSGLDSSLKQSESMVNKTGNLLGNIGKVAVVGAVAGFTALAAGIGLSVKAAMDSQKIQTQLNAVLESTHGVAGVTAEAANKLATSLSQVTPYDDELILSGENLLLTFTNIGKNVFPQATETALNMSTALGQDLQSSAIQLGKALQDPILGMTALRRVGVNFTDEQVNTVKALMANNDLLGAQTLILNELNTEFGGAAKAAGETFAGQLTILQTSLGNVMETIGGAFLPALTQIAQGLTSALNSPEAQAAINNFAVWLPQALSQVASLIMTIVIPAFQQFGGWIINEGLPFIQQLWNQFQQLSANVIAFLAPVFAELSRFWIEIQPKLAAAWSAISIMISTVMAAIQGFVHDHMTEIMAFLNGAWTAIQGVVTVVWNVISGIIKIALDLISGNFQAAGDDWRTMMDGIWRGIQMIFSGVLSEIQTIVINAFTGIRDAVLTKMWNVRDAIVNVMNNALDWLRSLPGQMVQIGVDIVQGIINGVQSMAGNLVGVLSTIVTNAVNAAKAALGIHSPSAVMAAVGQNMMAGLMRGWGGGTSLPMPGLSGRIGGVGGGRLADSLRGSMTFVYAPVLGVMDEYDAQLKLKPILQQVLRDMGY